MTIVKKGFLDLKFVALSKAALTLCSTLRPLVLTFVSPASASEILNMGNSENLNCTIRKNNDGNLETVKCHIRL